MNEYSVSVTEAAKRLNVTTVTIRRWIQDGRLPARRRPGTRPYRLREADVVALETTSKVVRRSREPEFQRAASMAGPAVAQMFLEGEEFDE